MFPRQLNQITLLLEDYIPMTPGNFVELGSGVVKGRHRGLGAYTIGQRARISGESEK